MIFTGRLLASEDGFSFWQEESDQVLLHLVTRGIVLDLSIQELADLVRAGTQAVAVAQTAEDEKDRTRRLQILQARVNDYLRRERSPRSTDQHPESSSP